MTWSTELKNAPTVRRQSLRQHKNRLSFIRCRTTVPDAFLKFQAYLPAESYSATAYLSAAKAPGSAVVLIPEHH